jgi:hypothetical protein
MKSREPKYWFWAQLAQITIQKKRVKARNPVGEIWINLVIISARDVREALSKASALGKADQGDSRGSLTLDNKPAITKFVGIKNAGVIHDDLGDGAEIVFEMRRGTLEKLRKSLMNLAKLKAEIQRELQPYHYRRLNVAKGTKRGVRNPSKRRKIGSVSDSVRRNVKTLRTPPSQGLVPGISQSGVDD